MKYPLSFATGLSLLILLGAGCTNKNTQQNNTLPTPPPIENKFQEPAQTTSTNNQTTTSTPTTTPLIKNTNEKPMDLSQYKTPIMIIDKTKTYTAKMKTTAGEMEIMLNAAATPVTVNNFVFLAKKNFYDNVIFHRVLKGFMIQGGDPTGTGMGGPGYTIEDESFEGNYTRGTLAMARTTAPNSAGSQFFIMHASNPLPPNYVIFGNVVSGLDVVDKIAEAPVAMSDSGEMSKPVSPVKIISVEIVEK